MNTRHYPILLLLWLSLWLSGCVSIAEQKAVNVKDSIDNIQREISQLLAQVNEKDDQHYRFDTVSPCRYEISVSWSNLDKGYYHATNRQRFSMTHDLRNIERLPAYGISYGDEVQHWSDRIELSFNRSIPASFEFVDANEFELSRHSLPNNRFNIGGNNAIPKPLVSALTTAFKQLAGLCNNDLSRLDLVSNKVIGRWQIVGLNDPEGTLTINNEQASLWFAKQQSITGSYTIEPHGQYLQMQLTPNNGDIPYYLWLDFVSSNYARLLLLGTSPEDVPFAPVWQKETGQHNAKEKKLFRLGDLR